jgi:acyl-CoA reductase-like NAD-dependent aldehyde dehydrogenase
MNDHKIFDPVVVKFENEEGMYICFLTIFSSHSNGIYKDIIKKANDTIYDLAAYVFSENITKAIEATHKLKAGSMFVNSVALVSQNLQFGGYKQAGFGREMGQYALDEYVMNRFYER